jgi:hypothetical protein
MSHVPHRSVILHRSNLGLGILYRICSGILYGSCLGILNGLWLGILDGLRLGILDGRRGRHVRPCIFAGRPSLELT